MNQMFYSDDPVADFERYDAKQQEALKQLPTCTNCGEPIQDDYLFDVDGELFCEECMKVNFKKSVENYIKEG